MTEGRRACAPIVSSRLFLTPLGVEDADEMVTVLGDPRLHEFIGGSPLALDALRARYARLVAGSSKSDETWLNWIVRDPVQAVGTVQATVVFRPDGSDAHVAWVIGREWQGRGYAKEAARAMVAWLDARTIRAHIRPDHVASIAVAKALGLRPTRACVDGETVWRGAADEGIGQRS